MDTLRDDTDGVVDGNDTGPDGIGDIENLIGSPLGDTLTGNSVANEIRGLDGVDTITSLGGPDALHIRDGGPDTASCGAPTPGPPPDTVTADQQGVDTINANCEQIDFLPTPPGPPEPPGPPPPSTDEDTTAPETTIDKAPKRKTKKRKARLEFSSNEPGSTFECKLDKKPFTSCRSPFRKKVKRRRHRFQVRSTDQAGNADPTPALHEWKVKKKQKPRP